MYGHVAFISPASRDNDRCSTTLDPLIRQQKAPIGEHVTHSGGAVPDAPLSRYGA